MLVSSTDRRLLAYAVCSADAAVLRVRDFLVDPSVPAAGTRLWLDLSREAIRLGYASLSIEFLGSERQQKQLGSAGFLISENRPVYGSVAPRADGVGTLPTGAATWYLTSADDD